MDDESVEVDRLAVHAPRDRAHEDPILERAEERLAARLQLRERLAKRWNRIRPDQLGLHAVCRALQLEQPGRDRRIGEIESVELQFGRRRHSCSR